MKIPGRIHEYRNGHHAELLQSGEPFFGSVESIIDEAQSFIHFLTYILDEDETGKRIVNALIRASKRGVRTYLLIDAFGTKYLTDEFIGSIENAGILFRFFSPTFMTQDFHLSLRLHSKVVMADGKVAIIGGMNIADRYRGSASKKEWLDFAVLIRGPECVHVLSILKKLWNRTFIPKADRSHEIVHDTGLFKEDIRLRVLQNNWYRNRIEILRSYRAAFKYSQKRMIIFNSYFLPGRNERKLLRNASMRGVEIIIVLSAESDAPMFKRATRFLYDFFLRNNIKIHEYLPSNLHAKVATVDGNWCTIGSYNLNHLSDYASIEMNVNIIDEGFVGKFEEILLNIIEKDCRQITIEEYHRRRTWVSKFRGWFSYQMIRILMRVMSQLTARKKKIH